MLMTSVAGIVTNGRFAYAECGFASVAQLNDRFRRVRCISGHGRLEPAGWPARVDPKLPVLYEEADVRELWHPAGNPQSQFTVAVILYGDQITVANW